MKQSSKSSLLLLLPFQMKLKNALEALHDESRVNAMHEELH
jgi:hypothetical protein